ncbi:MAG: pyruvate dehydrogenase complex dihydrolipoamide acetyltransferase [Hyphomicrobiales bacterium]
MPSPILMPALSPTMETGNLVNWLVKEGDAVASGDVLCEIETDKATMEVEAVDEGKIGKILITEGTNDVPVNTAIAILLGEGEDASALDGFDAQVPAAPAEEAAPPAATAKSSPAAAPAASPAAAVPGARIVASPLARRLASEKGLDLAAVTGSGPHGRIVKRDVEAAQPGALAPVPTPAAAPAPAPAPVSAPGDDAVKAFFEAGSYREVPHDGMRKIIARRLLESKLTIPHFYLQLDCQIDALLALRKELNAGAPADGPGAYKISVNDFIIKAMALALKAVPEANATWTEGAMLIHEHCDVGVAVAVEGGLFTPVIRQAETKPLSVISAEMKDYAARARARKLAPHEYQGGTTSISNLGMFGIKNFSAVINPPHATILAVGGGQPTPVVRDGALATATVMSVTLSCDHRAVDGALGANLLGAFKGYIEKPLTMLI